MTGRFLFPLTSSSILALALSMACSADPAPGNTGSGSTGTGSGGSGGDTGSGGTTGGATGSGGTTGGSAGSGAGGDGTGGSTGGTAGTGGSTGGTGGSGGGGATPVTPTVAGTKYTFSYGDVVFEVDAAVGGRIVTYTKGGVSILDATDPDATNYGSTFWPSPQTWPWGASGPASVDQVAYTATLEGATLVLQGPNNTTSGFPNVSVGKRFTVDSACDCVDIVYSMKNEDAGPVSVAPWEITRVDAGGITFWPAPAAPIKFEGNMMTGATYDATGMIGWFDFASSGLAAGNHKLYQDGTTWIAHAQGTLLLLKKFEDIPASAFVPEAVRVESQIEVYTNGTSYVEVENQGAYVELAAGMSLTYPVRWYLRSIPDTVTVASGSQTLYDFANALAQ